VFSHAESQFSDKTVNSVSAPFLTEGKASRFVLTPEEECVTAFRLTPSESGKYVFFSAGTKKDITARLYEDVGEFDSDDYSYIAGDVDDEGGFHFEEELSGGTTYTLVIRATNGEEDLMFDAGFCKEDTELMVSGSEITLTDDNREYSFFVYTGGDMPETDWISSDWSIVGWSSCWSMGSAYRGVTLSAGGSGKATMDLTNKETGEVYASFVADCSNITDYYDFYVSGVQVTSKNAANITGDGISGKVSYDYASNTLSLENAVLSSATTTEGAIKSYAEETESDSGTMSSKGYSKDEWGEFKGVISNHCPKPLTIKLSGSNKISNVEYIDNSSGSNYDASQFYSGLDGVDSCSSLSFTGAGSLAIDSSSIGTAVCSGRSVTISDGTSLDIRMTFNNNSNGIVASDSVTVNGGLKVSGSTYRFVVDGEKACTTGIGISTDRFVIGSSGSVSLTESTDCDATSYCVQLSDGGEAEISGTLDAKATGGEGEIAGVAIGVNGANGEADVHITGTGKVNLQGNEAALRGISLMADGPVVIKAGNTVSDLLAIAPKSYSGEKYLSAMAQAACTTHKLRKIEATESTEDDEGNTEYWLCNECGKAFGDAEGKTEISVEDVLIPRKPRTASNLFINSPSDGAVFDVGDTVTIRTESDIFFFRYISGILLEGAPNYIYTRVLKGTEVVASQTLSYYEAGQEVSTTFTPTSNGTYTIQVSKSSDFSSIRTVTIEVGPTPGDNPSDNPGTSNPGDNPSDNPGTSNPGDNPSNNPDTSNPGNNPSNNPGTSNPGDNPSNNPGTSDPQKPSDETPADRTGQTGSDGTALGAGASKEAAEAAIASMTSDSDLPGAVFNKLQLRSKKQTNTSISLSWKKVSGAKKYVIYGNKCGKTNKLQKLAESTGKSKSFKKVLGKTVKKGTYYKFMIVALDKNNNVVSSSKIIHVATKGGKVGNVGKVTTKAKKNKVSIKKGKTFKLKAKQVAAVKKLKVKKHRVLKYETTNKKIATVSSKGVIKGKKKGTCYVYVYAQNGVFAKIKVTVR